MSVEMPMEQTERSRHVLLKLAGAFVSAAIPILFIMVNVRLVMSPAFLRFEYTRPNFPADFYGFTQEDRLRYAPYAINYLLNGEDIAYLGDLKFDDGASLFNTRELRHMRDVKTLTQAAYLVAVIIGVLASAAAYSLWRHGRLYAALFRGALITLALIIAIVLGAILSWDVFFTGFHTLFFESDTWYFAYSDTLIRLFPEQFWFDAALLIGGLAVIEALVVIAITVRWRTRSA
jgi:integral membrane protein (TIGR01906 family)